MYDYDYVITRDENGNVCLAHSLFNKGDRRENSKYIAKIEDRGRTRYFYTQDELKAWQDAKRGIRNAAEKLSDKVGFSQRRELQEANQSKGLFSGIRRRRAQKAYDKTMLGKAEKAAENLKERASDAVGGLKNKTERMREEFQKRMTSQLPLENKVDNPKGDTSLKSDQNKPLENKVDNPKGDTSLKSDQNKPAEQETERQNTSMPETKGEFYRKGDPDFDDAVYSDENRVGDTDFFVHTRADGTSVIIEEDMKWVLPKGVDPKSPAIKKALEDFGDEVSSARQLGENYVGQQWIDGATKAINEAIRNAQNGSSDQQSNGPVHGKNVTGTVAPGSVYKRPMDTASRTSAAVRATKEGGQHAETASKYYSGRGASRANVDPRNVSSEYVIELAYNSGASSAEVKKLQNADRAHEQADRAWKRAQRDNSMSDHEKETVYRELLKAEQNYYDVAEDVLDKIRS